MWLPPICYDPDPAMQSVIFRGCCENIENAGLGFDLHGICSNFSHSYSSPGLSYRCNRLNRFNRRVLSVISRGTSAGHVSDMVDAFIG